MVHSILKTSGSTEEKTLYVQIKEEDPRVIPGVTEPQYELTLESCILSDGTDLLSLDTRVHSIFTDFCPTNASLYNHIDSPAPDVIRFSMPALRFFTEVSATWLTCSVIVCDLDSPVSECTRQRQRVCPPVVEPTTTTTTVTPTTTSSTSTTSISTTSSTTSSTTPPENAQARVKRAYTEEFGTFFEYRVREFLSKGRIIILDTDQTTEEDTVLGPVDSGGQTEVIIGGATAALLATIITGGFDLSSAFDDCAE
ncbi:uncharacterized protein LOC142345998 [Convolutriloba macropyga]|uniref:uncharacterized protein LOC142345998 n=1 Tax=Convolutriloba macropyga TaxID=536237 RepID=UPI003F524BDD